MSPAALAAIALGHVRREYPHVLVHVLAGPEDARTPAVLHPVFHGSLDWHSCVHAYWLLATVLRDAPDTPGIRALFDERLVPDRVAGECAYFVRPGARGFERPYGWAWLLALHHALRGTEWADALAPLARVIAARFHGYLPRATYPVRVGTHYNSAFALLIASPWAAACDPALFAQMRGAATAWYGADRGCQAWEPSQDDFLSSALTEAACMAVLRADLWPCWFDDFLPDLRDRRPATLFQPATVSDRSDGKIAHLDGLNLSRAWCWGLLGAALPQASPRRRLAEDAAARHRDAALPHLVDDYMGEHWLATFAMLATQDDPLDLCQTSALTAMRSTTPTSVSTS